LLEELVSLGDFVTLTRDGHPLSSLTGCGKTRRKTISAKSNHYYDHENASWINVVRDQKHFFRNLLSKASRFLELEPPNYGRRTE
jgi:hypothetical protein